MGGTCMPPGQAETSMLEWSTVDGPYSATVVMISYKLDPFSPRGRAWLKRLKAATANYSSVGEWYIDGEAPRQMDMANAAFGHFPMMICLMLGVVFVLMLVSFGSIIAPIRAMVLLIFMLVVTFGSAFLGMGSLSWMSPCISLPILIGLGLDYDIFYSEGVVEKWDLGYSEEEAAVEALVDTANVISAAGAIMFFAFAPLAISSTPLMMQIGFLLCVGIVVDCFFTTKVVIPAAVTFLGRCNFWPRRPHSESQER